MRFAAGWFASLLIALSAAAACAQARETAGGPGASLATGGGMLMFQALYGQRDPGGGFVFADFSPHWRFNVERRQDTCVCAAQRR